METIKLFKQVEFELWWDLRGKNLKISLSIFRAYVFGLRQAVEEPHIQKHID